MAAYQFEEYADILYCYGFADGDAAAARRKYQRRFPNRRLPDVGVFGTTYRRIRETGSVQRRQADAGRPPVHNPVEEEQILELFRADGTTSTRVVANQLGMSQWRVWFTLHSARLYPYHYTPVHAIQEGDPARRMDFCRFLLNTDIDDPEYLKNILWTDESNFDRDGITNYHNLHFWAPKGENPRKSKEGAHQQRFSLNVWMGIVHDMLIGPFFLPARLTGIAYEHFLKEELPILLEDVPLGTRMTMIYQHDGCPAHYYRGVRQWLDVNYPEKWIGRGGPIPWPARSPDLTPCDFHIWGHMKALVYDRPIRNVEHLREKIVEAAETTRQNMSRLVTVTEVRKRLYACIRNQGKQFEQDL